MFFPLKLALENAIFYIAACEAIALFSKRGKLHAAGGGRILRRCVGLYNHLYSVENKRFLTEEARLEKCANKQAWRAYQAEIKLRPLGRSRIQLNKNFGERKKSVDK